MAGLMKKSKPELVVGQMTEAEQQEGLTRRNEAGGSAGATPIWSADDSHSNTNVGAELSQLRDKPIWIFLPRQRPYAGEQYFKPTGIPLMAVDRLALDFAPTKPSSDRGWA